MILIPADGAQGVAIGVAVGETAAAIVSFQILASRSAALSPPRYGAYVARRDLREVTLAQIAEFPA